MKMGGDLSPIVYVLIIGGIAGYFIGYLIKRLLHLAVTIGVFAFLLMYMAYRNAISLNLDELGATITRFAETFAPLGLTSLASSAPFVGSFVAGLVLGLRRSY